MKVTLAAISEVCDLKMCAILHTDKLRVHNELHMFCYLYEHIKAHLFTLIIFRSMSNAPNVEVMLITNFGNIMTYSLLKISK